MSEKREFHNSAPESYTGGSLGIWLSTDFCTWEKKLLRLEKEDEKES